MIFRADRTVRSLIFDPREKLSWRKLSGKRAAVAIALAERLRQLLAGRACDPANGCAGFTSNSSLRRVRAFQGGIERPSKEPQNDFLNRALSGAPHMPSPGNRTFSDSVQSLQFGRFHAIYWRNQRLEPRRADHQLRGRRAVRSPKDRRCPTRTGRCAQRSYAVLRLGTHGLCLVYVRTPARL